MHMHERIRHQIWRHRKDMLHRTSSMVVTMMQMEPQKDSQSKGDVLDEGS